MDDPCAWAMCVCEPQIYTKNLQNTKQEEKKWKWKWKPTKIKAAPKAIRKKTKKSRIDERDKGIVDDRQRTKHTRETRKE